MLLMYRSLTKERPWAEHLTSCRRGGQALFWVFLHLTTKEHPCHVYSAPMPWMPWKQITGQIIPYNGTITGFEEGIAQGAHHISNVCLRKDALYSNLWWSIIQSLYYSTWGCASQTPHKLAHGWALIQVNFDPIPEVGPKVGGGHTYARGRFIVRLQY